MDGQRIEDLVGEDRPDGRGAAPVSLDHGVGEAGLGEPRLDRLDPARLDFDGVVGDGPPEPGPVAPKTTEDGQRQGPVAGAVLAQDERLGLAEATPGLVEHAGEGPAEDGMGLGCGQEVAGPPRARIRPAVVAARRVVQREVHEPGERHRAVAADLVADPGDQVGILTDGLEVRHRIAAQPGRHLHDGASSRPRSWRRPLPWRRPTTSRTPGPTSV